MTLKAVRSQNRAVSEEATDPAFGLREETAQWVADVCDEYELEPWHVKLLVLAGQAWDRAQEAHEILAVEGVVYSDRWGSPRPHPLVKIEEQARIAYGRCMRELDLSGEPTPERRPPRRGSVR